MPFYFSGIWPKNKINLKFLSDGGRHGGAVSAWVLTGDPDVDRWLQKID